MKLKKKNRIISKILLVMFCIGIFSGVNNVKAYENSDYNNKQIVKVGLEKILSNAITVKINGDYMVNSQAYSKGTIFQITASNGKVALNGIEQDSINFISQKAGQTLTLQNKYDYLGDMSFQIKTVKGVTGILPINNVNIEEYLKGVVAGEMYSTYELEALKAQAVAARSYTLRKANKHNNNGYGLCDTTDCQAYNGYDANLTNVNKAVDETRGIVLLSGGTLLDAVYSASNGGYTESSENVWGGNIPGCVSKVDSYDLDYILKRPDSGYIWTRCFTLLEIETSLKDKGYLLSTDRFKGINLNSISKYTSGRISSIEINYEDISGIQKKLILSKEKARTFLYVPSSNKVLLSGMYNVTFDAGTNIYTFSGKGYGHGVGMSQVGAQNRALNGQKYDEILKFYYENVTISKPLVSISSFTMDKNVVQVGDKVNLNVACQGGSSYLYKYVIDKAGKVIYQTEYSNKSVLQYETTEPGDYSVHLYVKDSSSTSEYDDKKDLTFSVINAAVKPGWNFKDGNWYFFKDGKAQTGWVQNSNKWYYMSDSGEMKTGWIQSGGKWYYMSTGGEMTTGWNQSGGKWYYMNINGEMKIGWVQSGSKWYYMSASGEMSTGWVQSGGKWYYLYGSGEMASDTTISGYKLGRDGAWIK